jgi:hypothetical protein
LKFSLSKNYFLIPEKISITALNPLSCQAYKNVQSVSQKALIKIDVDGSGPLDPFEVTCEFLSDGRVLTVLGHSSEHSTVVDSFQEPGSYDQTIEYNAKMPQIEALLNRSRECSQRLTYGCKSARLFNTPYCKLLLKLNFRILLKIMF